MIGHLREKANKVNILRYVERILEFMLKYPVSEFLSINISVLEEYIKGKLSTKRSL